MKRLLKICLVLFAAFFISARIYYRLTDDFRLGNITYEFPHNPSWETATPQGAEKKALEEIFTQKFTYLGKGAQVYAFGSDDNKYVIKFFKFKHIRPSILLQALPAVYPFKDYKIKQEARKERKVLEIFEGYKIAYNFDKENTGLIYLHLNKTDSLNLSVKLVDKLGFNYELALDDTVFILQKKGVALRDRLSESLQRDDLSFFKKDVSKILNMYQEEYQAGVYDHDHGVMKNSGFRGESPFHLDAGKFMYGDQYKHSSFYENDLMLVAKNITIWLNHAAPEKASELSSYITDELSAKFGHPVDLSKVKVPPKRAKKWF